MLIEVEVPQTIISNKAIEIEYSNSNTAIAEGTKELEVTVNRREYNIVGDELYIPKRYEDAPQWLRDIIDTVTSTAISSAISDVSTLGDMLDGLIAELEVAKNTYTISVISDNDINERINTAITTLNSSLADADSTILDVAMTRVTPEEAQTIALGILSASIAGGDISAAVQNLQSSIAEVDSARALDYTRLNASISDEFESSATAISTINAYVGIDEAGASTGTGLSAYLEDSNGVIGGADSQLNNTIKVTAEGIESKFEYNSMVNINGVYKKSGFGLTTNYTSGNGTEADPYVSEFWIDASRLKFTNSNQTGQTAPFTIDATGVTPQIQFNGVVAFSNVTGTSSLALTDMSNVTTIDGGKIVTNEVFVNNLNATGRIVANSIYGNEITGLVINGGIINGARINGAVIKASYLDLDGELEVLTNYHISVATRNANPSLYTDAVYISADNEYRIPSLSTIKEATASYYITSPTTKKGILYSYNTANVGTNNKAVKINPSFLATSSFQLLNSVCADVYQGGTFNHLILSIGGVNLLTYTVTSSGNNINISISGTYFTTKSFSFYVYTESSYSNSWTVDVGFATISLSYVFSAGTSAGSGGEAFYGVNAHTLTATVNTGQKLLPFNWNNANPITFQQIATPYSRSVPNGFFTQSVPGSTTFSLNQSLQINNMI